jgi:hypothetical protein
VQQYYHNEHCDTVACEAELLLAFKRSFHAQHDSTCELLVKREGCKSGVFVNDFQRSSNGFSTVHETAVECEVVTHILCGVVRAYVTYCIRVRDGITPAPTT